MASAPQSQLPLFYQDLMPLNTRDHAGWNAKQTEHATWLVGQHAVPVTADELAQVQRHYPVIFSSGDQPVPLALMGLNEGVNTFVNDDGKFIEDDLYIPAYIRRYPFMLARLKEGSDEMSLCFDPTSGLVGEFDEGKALFDGDKPSEETQQVMQFCERFEQAGQRTQAMMQELKDADILMDGEVSINQDNRPDAQPYVYRGFKMVDQEKLQNLPTETVEKWHKSGLLVLIHAHLMSLDMMRIIFARQTRQGKTPNAPQPANGELQVDI